MAPRKGEYNKYLKQRIPVGALVRVIVLDRVNELGVVVDANYGYVRNSWYRVHGLTTGKEYHVYPNEITWLRDEELK